uniref:Uncharacterized protein n=1 Tax=Romanomermis culicivorax TaxID=13658 RepID=A0A915IVG9_ROMCU
MQETLKTFRLDNKRITCGIYIHKEHLENAIFVRVERGSYTITMIYGMKLPQKAFRKSNSRNRGYYSEILFLEISTAIIYARGIARVATAPLDSKPVAVEHGVTVVVADAVVAATAVAEFEVKDGLLSMFCLLVGGMPIATQACKIFWLLSRRVSTISCCARSISNGLGVRRSKTFEEKHFSHNAIKKIQNGKMNL